MDHDDITTNKFVEEEQEQEEEKHKIEIETYTLRIVYNPKKKFRFFQS